jgi:S-adenosylmethionine:tRNA-ribosyltransferase-isomerase (queuine synthetase)
MAGDQIAPRAASDQLSQAELVKQIDQARVELGRTVDAIADMVKPANVARRTVDQLRQRIQTVDPKLAGAGAAVVAGVVALIVWRRRRR